MKNNNLVNIDKATLKSLKNVIKYLWKDEKKNWEENDRPDNHIFEDILALNCFYQENI